MFFNPMGLYFNSKNDSRRVVSYPLTISRDMSTSSIVPRCYVVSFAIFFCGSQMFLNNSLDHSNAKNLHAEVGELQDYLSVGFGASQQHQWHAQVHRYTVLLILVLCRCVGDSGIGMMWQNQLGSTIVDYLMLVALTVDYPPSKEWAALTRMTSMVENCHIETVDSSHIDHVHVVVHNKHYKYLMMKNAHMIVVATSPAVDSLVSLHMTTIALMAHNSHP
jgi:hypothetical protein